MPDPGALKQVVAELFDVAPDAIHAGFSLRKGRFQSSAGRGALAAAIQKRLGVYSAAAFTAAQYGELERAVLGTAAETPADGATSSEAPAPEARRVPEPSAVPGLPGVRLGVDVEMVESMPDVPDYWTAPFYQAHFTPAEIAYCVRQEHPRVHFAARWCAKEALAKCDARYAGVSPTAVQVGVGPGGEPVLEAVDGSRARRIDFAISLSHTPLMAIAVVASIATNGASPSPSHPPENGPSA